MKELFCPFSYLPHRCVEIIAKEHMFKALQAEAREKAKNDKKRKGPEEAEEDPKKKQKVAPEKLDEVDNKQAAKPKKVKETDPKAKAKANKDKSK